ncbi:uncharacterized protein LOC119441421 [Dermacentor silvarum]|uniref:uncharacterized protein LOC119441421 n=1 Tax=Dermacentor silvarum TaxID=543639 RepID=UPI0018998538|nr:uncharacterized protein LOC119441421 [Dermacentor silvarum]
MLTVPFLILSIYALSAVIATGSCPDNDDGWAFMAKTATMYLTERNFNTDPQKRDLTRCVSAITTNTDGKTHEIQQTLTYYNTSSTTWITFPKRFTASAWGTGTNKLNYFTALSSSGQTLTYLVLHSEEDCLVAKVVYLSSENLRACELWVTDSYFGNTKSSKCCDSIYKSSCEPTVQTLYKKEECANMKKTKKDKGNQTKTQIMSRIGNYKYRAILFN